MISIIDDKNLLDFDMVYQFTTTYSFSKGISREKFNMAVHNSWCFGIMVYNKQVGFARLITDYATFAFLKDLFILPDYRNNGYALSLVKHIISKIKEKDIRRTMLGTFDQHSLFKNCGFDNLKYPNRFMEYDLFEDYITDSKW